MSGIQFKVRKNLPARFLDTDICVQNVVNGIPLFQFVTGNSGTFEAIAEGETHIAFKLGFAVEVINVTKVGWVTIEVSVCRDAASTIDQLQDANWRLRLENRRLQSELRKHKK